MNVRVYTLMILLWNLLT